MAVRGHHQDLVGRDRELAALDRALGELAAGRGSVVMIEGAPGTGKSRLLDELAAAADDPLTARAVELDTALPLGVASRLLRRPLPDLSETALAEGGAAALQTLVGAASSAVPRVLAVDDVQWADQLSVELLVYLAELAPSLPVLLAVAARRGGVPARLRSAGMHFALSELGAEDAAVLVRRRLPRASSALVEVCVRVTGGNPFLLCELTDSIAAAGTAEDEATPDRIAGLAPQTVTDGVLTRLGRLGAPAAALARALAILGDGAPLRHVARLAGLDADAAASAADALVASDVMRPANAGAVAGALAFRHPLLASAVLDDLGTFTRGRLYRLAADVVAAEGLVDRAGAHLLQADAAGDGEAVRLLRAAAAAALGRGDAATGARLLERALAEPPPLDERPAVLLELARAEAAVGDERAVAHLDEALRSEADAGRRAEVLHDLSRLLYLRGDTATAVRLASRALSEIGDGHPAAGRMRAAWLLPASVLADTHEASLELTRALARAALAGEAPRDPELRAIVALDLVCTGHADAAVDLADAALAAPGDALTVAPDYALHVLLAAGRLRALVRASDRALAAAEARDSVLGAATAVYWRGRARLELGDLDAAEDDARSALASRRYGWLAYVPHVAALLATIRLERADLAGARQALAILGDDDKLNPMFRFARGHVALASGDAAGALAAFAAAGQVLEEVWLTFSPVIVPWRSAAAVAALRAGNREEAEALSASELEIARREGVPVALARALRARGLVAGDVELLREAAALLAGDEHARERVRTRVELGGALRRAGARREAREVLAAARAEAEGLGLAALAARARDEQDASGARPRRIPVSGVESLTPSELRIAQLAAAGATNREIGAELFLTPKTVGWHLGNVFRKLDISSRRALASALDDTAG